MQNGVEMATPASTYAATSVFREWYFAATIVLGLAVDQAGRGWPIPGEYIVDIAVWWLFFQVFRSTEHVERTEMLAVLMFATPLELLASETWGLYTYRSGLMPLFVPPGHWLLFAIGRRLASELTRKGARRATVLVFSIAAISWWGGLDASAGALALVLLAFVALGPEPGLYVTMVGLALAMEILGTRLGNWTWAPEIPGTHVSVTNPPLLCGVAYAFGDLVVAVTTRRFR